MANPHHPAAHGDQRRGGKAEFLRPQQQRYHHVVAGHQLAVRFQRHLLAKAVSAQHLMGFGQADFPGQASVMHAAHRRGSRAALAAGNQDAARSGFRNPAGDGTNAGGGNQFDGDLGLLIGALQIVDQFGQILDGINIMVRRRGNQGNARGGAAGFRHAVGHFSPRQVAALAGFRPLGHFDLDLLGGKQVFPCNTKAAGSHLLDGGIEIRSIARGQFAALAAVALAAQMVHGLGHALMGFLGNGAVAHGPGAEAPNDFSSAFHFLHTACCSR